MDLYRKADAQDSTSLGFNRYINLFTVSKVLITDSPSQEYLRPSLIFDLAAIDKMAILILMMTVITLFIKTETTKLRSLME